MIQEENFIEGMEALLHQYLGRSNNVLAALAQIQELMTDMLEAQQANYRNDNLLNDNGEEIYPVKDIYADHKYVFIVPITIRDIGEDVDPITQALSQVASNLRSSQMQHVELNSSLNDLRYDRSPYVDTWINQFESAKRNRTRDEWKPGDGEV